MVPWSTLKSEQLQLEKMVGIQNHAGKLEKLVVAINLFLLVTFRINRLALNISAQNCTTDIFVPETTDKSVIEAI